MTIRERFEKLQRFGLGEGTIANRPEGHFFYRDDVLAMADKLDRELAALLNELVTSYAQARGEQ